MNMFCRMPMLQALGMSLGLGLMSPACSAPESMNGDPGYYPTPDAGSGDGGHDAGPADPYSPPPVQIERVSVATDGTQGNGPSDHASISSSYVVFRSAASNLVADDTNNAHDVFIRDLIPSTKSTRRISVNSSGEQADDRSGQAFVSANGRYVTFDSWASNLAPFNTNGVENVYVRDRDLGVTSLVSIGLNGSPAGGSSWVYQKSPISEDGRYVAFSTSVVYLRDLLIGATELISIIPNPHSDDLCHEPSMNPSARFIAFGCFEGASQSWRVFVRDRQTQSTEIISVGANGKPIEGGAPSISADGRYVAFGTSDEAFIRDRQTNSTRTLTDGNFPSMSANGRVAYMRNGGIWIFDPVQLSSRQVIDSNGVPINGTNPAISGNGEWVVFHTGEALVPEDTNGQLDVYHVGIWNLFEP